MQKKVAPTPDKPSDPVQTVDLLGQFFGDKHGLLLLLVILVAAIVGGLVAFSLYEITTTEKNVTFATTEDGRLFPPAPLNTPGKTQPEILQWAVEALTRVYSFNFIDYKKSILSARGLFTDTGYRHYLKALTDSNTINAVITNKFVVAATPTSAPIILKEAILSEGVYSWQIKIPILVEFNSSEKQSRQNLIVVMTIKRVPEEESEEGVAISSFLAREGKI